MANHDRGIRPLTPSDMDKARYIWSVCFGDPPEFIDWYFETRKAHERAIGLFEDGVLVSDTLMIHYSVHLRGKTVQAPYIVGAATLPEHRRKGHMERVLKEALEHMRASGAGITFLHPFRDSFYRRLGWENATNMLEYTLPAERLRALGGPGEFEPIEHGGGARLWPVYLAMAAKADPALVRGARECEFRIEETLMDGGFGVLGGDAYALCHKSEGRNDVHELIYNKIEDIYPLLFEIALTPGAETISFALPGWEAPPERFTGEAPPKLVPYMMMRVVDVEKALSGLQFSPKLDGALTLSVTDALCPWNEGVFRVELSGGLSKAERVRGDFDASMDITALAALLAGHMSFEEALAAGLAHIQRENELLSAAFTRLNGFILEKY